MKAGVEIDLLIAEHVMGAEWVTEDDEQPEACPYLQTDHWVFYPKVNEKFPNSRGLCGMPEYSKLISRAWEVIEQIHKDGHGWTLVSKYRSDTYIAYKATGCADPDFGEWFAYGDTAAHAICMAALKAKGIE